MDTILNISAPSYIFVNFFQSALLKNLHAESPTLFLPIFKKGTNAKVLEAGHTGPTETIAASRSDSVVVYFGIEVQRWSYFRDVHVH